MAIAIVALLFAVGVGVYMRMNRGFALRAAVSSLESALRAARAAAVHERCPAVVMVVERQVEPPPALPQVERIYALARRTVSCWHFEASQFDGKKLKGALGQEGAVQGTVAPVAGKIGRAISFDGASSYVEVPSPYFAAVRDGVFVEAYVWPDPTAPKDGDRLPVASRRDGAQSVFSLALRCKKAGSGPPVFWLEGSVYNGSEAISARTDWLIPAGEWTHVALSYVGDAKNDAGQPIGVVLQINGQEVELFDVAAGGGPLAASSAPLHIGEEGGACFIGRLDELRVAALASGEVHAIPKNATAIRDGAAPLAKDAVATSVAVRFDEEGKLDRRFHQGDIVRFRVYSPADGLRRVVQVNWLGAVEVLQDERKVE